MVRQIENEVYAQYFAEVPTTAIGDLVMEHLRQLDQVAYVRFASVYRDFRDVGEFTAAVEGLKEKPWPSARLRANCKWIQTSSMTNT